MKNLSNPWQLLGWVFVFVALLGSVDDALKLVESVVTLIR